MTSMSDYQVFFFKSFLFLQFNHLFNSDLQMFQTPINWKNCAFLLIFHILALYSLKDLLNFGLWTSIELVGWWMLTGFGITAGAHRLWSHRSYKARFPTRFFLMILQSMANQGTIAHWARDHRIHHKHSDTNLDPHNITRGFFYSHMGWLLLKKQPEIVEAGKKVPMDDIMNDPVCKIQNMFSPLWNQFWCFLMPSFYGMWRFSELGPMLGFWHGYLIFGVLRWILCLHGTWCVNSVAHTFGYRPYSNIKPVESFFTSLLAVGEGWHNYHHTYPYDYATSENGVLGQYNPTKLLIDLRKLFLFCNLKIEKNGIVGYIGQTYEKNRASLVKKKKEGKMVMDVLKENIH